MISKLIALIVISFPLWGFSLILYRYMDFLHALAYSAITWIIIFVMCIVWVLIAHLTAWAIEELF